MNDISAKHRLQISVNNRTKIYLIFEDIDKILPQVKGNRKRMISIEYILRQLFEILRMKYELIPLSKSKTTLKYYNQWWNTVFGLIKDDIHKIINK